MIHQCFKLLIFRIHYFALASLYVFQPVLIRAEESYTELAEPVGQENSYQMTSLPKRNAWHPENNQQKQYYFIKRPTVGGQLSYEFTDNSQLSNDTEYAETSHQLKEKVSIQTSGWAYSPALMKFSLMVEPEFIQSHEETTQGEMSRSSTFAPDYVVSATFLELKPYSLNIFGNRQEISAWAPFSGASDSTTNSYGANGQLKYKTLPTTMGYSHTETELLGFYSSHVLHDHFNLSSTQQTERSNTMLTSNYSKDIRSIEHISNDVTSFNNYLSNNYRITPDNKLMLNSAMTYNIQESGWYDTQNINLQEHLGWHHTPNLQSNYSASHARQESGDFSTDKTTLNAGLTHLLYENLTTNVGNRISQCMYFDGKETATQGFLNFSYSRPLSWTTLGLNTGWDYLYTDRSGFNSIEALVTNETHTLSLSKEAYLNHFNVTPDSIIVTNTSGSNIYLQDIDYSVETLNGYVRIRRIPFGSITDGQTIAVTYRYQQDSAYTDAVLTENYGFNFDLWHDWRFSYNLSRINQNILSGEAPRNLIDDTIQRADIRYDIGWSNTTIRYEDSNRQASPTYTRREIHETLSFRPNWQINLLLKGSLGQTKYKDHDETDDFFGGATSFDWMLNRRSKFSLEYFLEKTSGKFEETENSGLKACFEFRYRIWTTRLSYQITDQNYMSSHSQRTKQLARVEFIRANW